ncbi:hypothetical protein [Qipengyuania vesicularis]|uniref:hypothetical protein n=1 Tax=Qipengyuania vesicularis TaxID=2867232 RepID=UPI001C86F337|nr:hypothetical protein [Qipengyuania vesicularis]MBX7526549.1 hypothetical protein [Qipengyuania vesicularis]
MAQTSGEKDDFGMLLGWRADPAGEKIALLMQSSSKVVESDDDVREYRYFLTKQQAVQLGNFLYGVAGETPPPPRKPGLLERLLGG